MRKIPKEHSSETAVRSYAGATHPRSVDPDGDDLRFRVSLSFFFLPPLFLPPGDASPPRRQRRLRVERFEVADFRVIVVGSVGPTRRSSWIDGFCKMTIGFLVATKRLCQGVGWLVGRFVTTILVNVIVSPIHFAPSRIRFGDHLSKNLVYIL